MAGTSATAQGVSFGALAVNLECLGAEFYSWAAFGMGLSEDLRAGGPLSVGGRKALLSPVLQVCFDPPLSSTDSILLHVILYVCMYVYLCTYCLPLGRGTGFNLTATYTASTCPTSCHGSKPVW